jgi:hypothetical protein
MTAHEQGAWITRTYSGANYTGTGCTWTVDSGDVVTDAYYLRGRTLLLDEEVGATTTSSAACTSLNVLIPGSFTAVKTNTVAADIQDSTGAGTVIGKFRIQTSTTVGFQLASTAAFAAQTNAGYERAQISIEVQ